MSNQSEVFRDETIPVVVHFSLSEDTACTLEGDDDGVYYWQIPDFMTDSLFADFLTEIVDAISDQDTKKFLQLLHPSPEELRRLNQKRTKWFCVSDDETHKRVREIITSFGDIVPHPSLGNITSVDVRINNELADPSGELRRNINQLIASTKIECYSESDGAEETDECLDTFVDHEYLPDEEEEIDKEVRANPEKPCYYPAQIEMAAIMKKRIDTIMSHYHKIPRLSDVFNDVEFVVYTARYRMLSDQTEKRICHPDTGVLSKEELELKSRDDCNGKKRMFMYVRSQETETHFEELKTNVQEKPRTLFVIIADECHWGITKDKEEKHSAHNLFINEWSKDNSPKNVVVIQISATPFNLLTQNSRLPVVTCVLLNDKVSTTSNEYQAGDLVVLNREPNLEEHVRNNSKEVELHVVHWSEVELKNFEMGMRMKIKSALNSEDASYRYLRVSSDGKLSVTSIEDDSTDFIVQGSHGIVTLKALPATKEQHQAKPLTVIEDSRGNLEAKVDPQQPTKFEVKLDFGIGVVAFCSCRRRDHYIAVDECGDVTLQAAKVERKCGVSIMKPIHDLARISFEFYIDRCGPVEVDKVGQQYMSLNFYLSTMNCSNKNDQKIREDESFQKIVDKAKRQKRMTRTDSSSFPIDALLCAEYCYHVIHLSVYDGDEKIRQALISSFDDSPAAEFEKYLNSFSRELTKETAISKKIHPSRSL
ncbi:GREB1-like protein [Desmophyllum pertusum]|uniref:GREB1-like protein n=1 Tax=Desmophyllum pertusum TaxID=174260 RepID=A0A9W9Y945_9CNID|nr:GREB1-like protein [Desmophyllum pertusum]